MKKYREQAGSPLTNRPSSLHVTLPGVRRGQLKKGAHNPEWATHILGLCQGVFMNQFIFSTFKGTFSCENRISEAQDIKKENNH